MISSPSRFLGVLTLALLISFPSIGLAQRTNKRKKPDLGPNSRGTVTLEYRRDPSQKEYARATMSFEYADKKDHKWILNDWDIVLDGNGTASLPYDIKARMTGGDKSDIWDVGKVRFSKVTQKSVNSRKAKKAKNDPTVSGDGLPPKVGHVYVVHTNDRDSNFWTKFKVTDVTPKKSVTIEWELLTEPQRVEGKRLAKIAADKKRRAAKKKKQKQTTK